MLPVPALNEIAPPEPPKPPDVVKALLPSAVSAPAFKVVPAFKVMAPASRPAPPKELPPEVMIAPAEVLMAPVVVMLTAPPAKPAGPFVLILFATKVKLTALALRISPVPFAH